MGIADAIPGISGSTVAFMAGVYEPFLEGIRALQLHDLKKIPWAFLLPLGGGIGLGLFVAASLLHLLLSHPAYQLYVYALFFGVVVISTWTSFRTVKVSGSKRLIAWLFFALGFGASFCLSSNYTATAHDFNAVELICLGMLASGALLMPGISGCYLLCLCGVYPRVIAALAHLSTGWPTLLPFAIGVACGLILFSRLISYLLRTFRWQVMSLMTGFMAGGLKSIWPFQEGAFLISLGLVVLGVLLMFIFIYFRNNSSLGYNKN